MKIPVFSVSSMPRSGTHAIINWVAGHFDCLFEFAMIDGAIYNFNTANRTIKFSRYDRGEDGGVVETQHNLSLDKTKEMLRQKRSQAIILSYMNLDVAEFCSEIERNRRTTFLNCFDIDSTEPIKNLLIIRTPWNQYASILRCKFKLIRLRNPRRFARRWVTYAKEFIGKTSYIGDKVTCNYDEWFKSVDYRKSLSNRLGLEFSDYGLNSVGIEGYGSSFDGYKYQGCAQKMDVCERWKQVKETKEYDDFKASMSRKRLLRMAFKIFRCSPPLGDNNE